MRVLIYRISKRQIIQNFESVYLGNDITGESLDAFIIQLRNPIVMEPDFLELTFNIRDIAVAHHLFMQSVRL